MTDQNSIGDAQNQEDSSPDGVESELELTARFQNMLQSIALTRARYRGSEKKTDADYDYAFKNLVTSPDLIGAESIGKKKKMVKLAHGLGIALIVVVLVTWRDSWWLNILHIIAGGLVFSLGNFLEKVTQAASEQ